NILQNRRKQLLVDELITVLGGPPDEPKRLSDGAYLFTACQAHSCPEKGAVILSPKGEIIAAAMITEVLANRRDSFPFTGLSLDIFVGKSPLQEPWRTAI